MKRIFYMAAYITMLLSFTACSSDTPTDDDDNLPVLSYFKGTINNVSVNIEQKHLDDTDIYAGRSVRLGDDILLYSWDVSLPLTDKDGKKLFFAINFAPLHKGKYDMRPVTNYDEFRSEVKVLGTNITYLPSKAPFEVTIDSILAYKDDPNIDWGFPRITGTMKGIMYNTENPKDSIEFKEIKFRVWSKK